MDDRSVDSSQSTTLQRFAVYRVRPGVYRTTDKRFTIRKQRVGPRGGARWVVEARDYADAEYMGADGEATWLTKEMVTDFLYWLFRGVHYEDPDA